MTGRAVELSARVRTDLPERLHARTRRELAAAFAGTGATRATATQLFAGYTPDFDHKVIVGVLVERPDGYATHIVKLGSAEKVGTDADGWAKCTAGRMIASRIFAPVRAGTAAAGRHWVVYQDAYTLFGLDGDNRPQPLQQVAEWAVLDDKPDLLSVERAVAHVFTDLGRWFHPWAAADPAAAQAFYRKVLAGRRADTDVFARWEAQPDSRELRRAAVWVLAGRDPPDADPVADPAGYLDPVEYVRWAVKDPARLPDTLVGRGHGDLHGQNVLVGVRRGEAEYPAVFDYGEMGDRNVLAWDFAKLENELKVRLLPRVLAEPPARDWLLARGGLRKPGPADPGRPDRLAALLAFEHLLHDLADKVETEWQAEQIRPFAAPPTGVRPLDRLLGLLLRVRKEAALWLGFRPHGRLKRWREEYAFALAAVGLLHVRWHYDCHQREAAVVSAGAAVARMPAARQAIAAEVAAKRIEDPPSYRVPLAVLHRLWRGREYAAGRGLARRLVLEVTRDEAGPARELAVRPAAAHAVPLIAEAALVEAEAGHTDAAERLLDPLRRTAREYADHETLGRIGRLFKDAADAVWPASAEVPFHGCTAWQLYRQALTVYDDGYRTSGDCYVGVNVCSLALLTGDLGRAQEVAERVAGECEARRELARKDRYWLFATEGEAAAVLGRWPAARGFLADALGVLGPGEYGQANSTYKQLCRLWRRDRDAEFDRLLRLFEEHPRVRAYLAEGFLGRGFKVGPG